MSIAATEQVWTVTDGTAVGPEKTVDLGGGREAVVTAIWSDVDGVGVTVWVDDEHVPADRAAQLAEAIRHLALTPEPRF